MARLLPPIAASLGSLGLCLGAAMLALAAPAEAPAAPDCPLRAERFFATESTAPDGAALASYFVLLRNPEPQARAYGLSFDRAEAMERRSGARATLPGETSLPVLLGREILPPGAEPLAAAALAGVTRLSCRG